MKKNRLVSTAIAGTLAAAILVGGGTFAYLKANTNTVTNTFTGNAINVELNESGNHQYSIIPGTTAVKDPKVTVETTVPAYVFVTVEDTVNSNGQQDVVEYSIDTAWTKLEDGVYYKDITSEGLTNASVLKDNAITYTDTYVANTTEVQGTLKFKAYVIQKDGFNNAAAAWAEAQKTN